MKNSIEVFETKNCTLLAGPDEKKLYVPRGLLSRIPFFNEVLATDREENDSPQQIDMSDFDPNTLADVLYFFWAETVPKLCYNKENLDAEKISIDQGRLLAAYLVAQDLDLTRVQKDIEYTLVLHFQDYGIDPTLLIFLHKHGLRDSFLYKFMVAEVGYEFAMSRIDLSSKRADYQETCEEMSGEIWWDLMIAVGHCSHNRHEPRPAFQVFWLNDGITGSDVEEG